jgi:hypothetical protein
MSKKLTGTREWSESSANVMKGCSNNCLYCYAKAQAIRFKRSSSPESWVDEVPVDPFPSFGKRKGVVMFPTTHDLTKGNFEHIARAIGDLLNAGNQLLVVSKPDPDVIIRLCHQYPSEQHKSQILFRFTIGSYLDRTLKFWEPGAPSFADRLYALMWCYRHGWKTSVSMEPMLEGPSRSGELVDIVDQFVTDTIWIGKMNNVRARLALNGVMDAPGVRFMVEEIEEMQSDFEVMKLHQGLKGNPKVRWKDSIQKVIDTTE